MEGGRNGSSATIMDLPDDCLVLIFKCLGCEFDCKAFGLTCRRWLEIENQNRESLQFVCSLTNFKVPLSGNLHKIDTYKLQRTLNRFPHLKSLSLSGCTELPDLGLKLLQNYGSTLRALHLDCCLDISDVGLSFVATGCPSLTFISLYRCNVTDIGLEILTKGCSALEAVNLSHCSLITDQGIQCVVQNCFQLRAIRISNCPGISGVGFKGCSQSLAYMEAESCKLDPVGMLSVVSGGGLKYLNVAGLSWSIHGDGLAAIGAGYATRLRVLNTRLCRTMRDESAAAIAKGCPSLVEWNLALCHEIKVAGWQSIALHCHNLEKLHVNRCRNFCDLGMEALKNGCKKLSILYMNGCPRISAFGVELFKLARGEVIIKGEELMAIAPGIDVW